ncbi:MAG: MBL fold metallo-hydrolase [Bacteroidales bacterium]|nr:MBL fold metallo-hydrolase [Bacteroidales bacterium]
MKFSYLYSYKVYHMIRLTFLGTGTSQGVPIIGCKCKVCTSQDPKDKRLRSSVLIEHNNKKILIDAGPDFRQQLLRENIGNLDAIILTHEHKDHTGGLDDVRAINYLQKKILPIYCEKRVEYSLHKEYSYAFCKIKYPGVPEFDIKTIDNTPFKIGDITITPIRVYHYKLPILGFRIGNITYITDANRIDPKELEKIFGSEILVLNTIRKEKHISHFSLLEAIEVAKKVNSKATYLTHLSHQIGTHSELSSILPQGIYASYDGLTIETK